LFLLIPAIEGILHTFENVKIILIIIVLSPLGELERGYFLLHEAVKIS